MSWNWRMVTNVLHALIAIGAALAVVIAVIVFGAVGWMVVRSTVMGEIECECRPVTEAPR